MNTSTHQYSAGKIGANLKLARKYAGIGQSRLARLSGVDRLVIVRAESGKRFLNIQDCLLIANALKIPLEKLTTGRWRPRQSIQGIAVELYRLGIRDLVVPDSIPPGAFRPTEEVLCLALKSNRPEPRIIEAIPFVLSKKPFDARLVLAYAQNLDGRVRNRLAWLCDVTLTLSKRSDFKPGVEESKSIEQILKRVKRPLKQKEFDSLGHPDFDEKKVPLVWKRWRINYAGRWEQFIQRAQELNAFDEVET